MLELIKYVVGTFAEHQDDVKYDIQDKGREVIVTVTLNPLDMGKVIGRQGKIAKALRTLVHAGSQKENKKYTIEIRELGETK